MKKYYYVWVHRDEDTKAIRFSLDAVTNVGDEWPRMARYGKVIYSTDKNPVKMARGTLVELNGQIFDTLEEAMRHTCKEIFSYAI